MNNKNLPPEKTRRAGHLLHHTGKNTLGNSKSCSGNPTLHLETPLPEPPERDPEPMQMPETQTKVWELQGRIFWQIASSALG
jgi:hypothetical protein